MEQDFNFSKADNHLSLIKLSGMKLIDVIGYVSRPFGDGETYFIISSVVLENEKKEQLLVHAEGEHDTPYLYTDKGIPHLDSEFLGKIYDDTNEVEEDTEEEDIEEEEEEIHDEYDDLFS